MAQHRLELEEIGGYRLEDLIGEGGMGAVYRAYDPALERPVAIKVLFEIDDEEAAERFLREARALARLTHPNVVQVYAHGRVEGFPYFAMELVEGAPLSEVLAARGALVPEEAASYALQAARGLEAAAQAGVIHRDVKPHNLILRDDGTVKLVDFGLARIGAKPGPHTEQGVAMGTPAYMAPEQARGEALDERSDQYALGATLYHLLSGQPPFAADSDVALLMKHQQQAPPPLLARAPQVGEALWQVVARMLAKRPEDRFANYDELCEALLDSLDQAPRRPPRVAVHMGLGIFAAALVAGLLLAGLAWWRLHPRADRHPVAVTPARLTAGDAPDAATDAPGAEEEAQLSAPVPIALHEDAGDPVAEALERVARAPAEQRQAAIEQLAKIDDPRVLRLLVALLYKGEETERALAARLLGEIGDQSVTPALISALQLGDRNTLLAVIGALAELRDLRAVEPLAALAEVHADPEVRAAARQTRARLFDVQEGARRRP